MKTLYANFKVMFFSRSLVYFCWIIHGLLPLGVSASPLALDLLVSNDGIFRVKFFFHQGVDHHLLKFIGIHEAFSFKGDRLFFQNCGWKRTVVARTRPAGHLITAPLPTASREDGMP